MPSCCPATGPVVEAGVGKMDCYQVIPPQFLLSAGIEEVYHEVLLGGFAKFSHYGIRLLGLLDGWVL